MDLMAWVFYNRPERFCEIIEAHQAATNDLMDLGIGRFPIDNIEVEYFITRRKVYEGGDFPQKRIQEFKPAAGKVKINKSTQLLESFLTQVFTDEPGF
jgi:hypothetical protein